MSVAVRDALNRRYQQHLPGTKGEQWVVLQEARSGAGFAGNDGQCDYLAINTRQSRGLQLVGHEIKVSAGDWKRELAKYGKAETFNRFCHRWWVAAPSELATKIKSELPTQWGLLSVSEQGRITETVVAPRLDPQPVPIWWWIGWLAQIDRTQKRTFNREIEIEVRKRVDTELTRIKEIRADDEASGFARLGEKIDGFHAATGINLRHAWNGDFKRLGQLWSMRNVADLDRVAVDLRRVASTIEALTAETEGEEG